MRTILRHPKAQVFSFIISKLIIKNKVFTTLFLPVALFLNCSLRAFYKEPIIHCIFGNYHNETKQCTMRILRNIAAILCFLAVCIGVANGQSGQRTLRANDIINKAIDAMGGKAYLQSIKTLYTDFKTNMDGHDVDWIIKEMLPNKGSFAIIYQGRTVYKNWFDGQQGYELAGGEKKADTGDFDDKPYKKNIFDELDYLDTSLWKIALVGEDTVNQHSCYKIRGILANGSIQIWYYDKATYYLLRKDRFNDPEKGKSETSYFSDYKKSGKLPYYTKMQFGSGDSATIATIADLKINEQISDSDFNQ